jgi:four helix bundle protein
MDEEGAGFRHERLDVWQKAIEWAQGIYVVSAGFPEAERFGLQAQMRRAAVSVASNIAEGAGRYTAADFARFVEIAYGSLMETVCQATIAHNLGYMNAHDHDRLRTQAETIARMLSSLRRSRLSR